MQIAIKLTGMLTGEVKEIVCDDMLSPDGGYTQKYADQLGKSYEDGRATELFGEDDFWEWTESTYIKRPARGEA